MKHAYIGLGSNMGDRLMTMKNALELIGDSPSVEILGVSSVYETEPVDFVLQPSFLNAVARLRTDLLPHDLLRLLQGVEMQLGRVRTIRFGPRTIDLDVLLYEKEIINTEQLIIPHPRMWERLFVLKPLSELCPDLRLPSGETVSSKCDLLQNSQRIHLFGNALHDIIKK